jgi:cystathionine beta-lyase/cystathionine gamma-synthase
VGRSFDKEFTVADDARGFETGQIDAGPDLVRRSVGLETISDILADLDAGFRAAKS